MYLGNIETLKALADTLSTAGIGDTSGFNAADTTNYVRTLSIAASTWTPVLRFWVPFSYTSPGIGFGVALRVKNRTGATRDFTVRFLINGTVWATSSAETIANNAESKLGTRARFTGNGLREVVVELHSTGAGNVDILYAPWQMLEDSPV